MDLVKSLKLRVTELHVAVPSSRVLVAWLIVFAFALQTQIIGGHIHPPKAGHPPKTGIEASITVPSNDGHGPKDPRSDSQCIFCQQLSSAQPFVATAAPEALLPLQIPFGIVASAQVPLGAKLVSFAWLSRAPPAA